MSSNSVAPPGLQSFAFGPFVLVPKRQLLLENGAPVRIGSRALDILTVLVGRQGETVDKAQLMALVWPSTVVEESNLKVNMVALRKLLGERADEPSYIATISGRGYKFIAPVRISEAPEFPSSFEQAARFRRNLPPMTKRIVGRDAAIDDIQESLNHSRLVTIVGPGGIGKTTVAVAVAERIEQTHAVEVTFIDLSRVATEEFVAASLSAALGISSVSGDSLQAIVAVLAKRKTLLVFDTCEHVLGAVAHAAQVILAKTADVRILATSRQVLHVRDEKIEWLGPLEVPPVGSRNKVDILRYSAARLLLDRASERSGFILGDDEASAFAEICRRLDGAPLAMELVASRFAGRTAASVLEELDQRFRTLTLTGPGSEPRQQTLLATLQWSYSLLATTEATVLRVVSIFAGAFDIDSAVAIVAHHGLDLPAVFDAISGLRAKSMLSVDQSFGRLRYRLLDTTRTFAGGLLAANDELPQVSAMHARLLLDLLTQANAERAVLTAVEARTTFVGLADDLRKALDWALYQRGDPGLGIHLVAVGLPLWSELSLGEEIRANCERAVTEFDRAELVDKALKLKLIVGLASANTYLSTEHGKTVALYESAIQLAQATQDASSECRVLSALITYSLLFPGRARPPLETLETLRVVAERTSDRPATREYELLRAHSEINAGNFPAYYSRLEKLHGEIGDLNEGSAPRFQIFQKVNIEIQFAAASWFVGRPEEAMSRALAAARSAIETSHALTLVNTLARGVIWALYLCGEYRTARHYADLLADTVYRCGLSTWIPAAEYYSAIVDFRLGERRSPELLRASFESLRTGIVHLRSHGHFASLALALVDAGRPDDAVPILDYLFGGPGPARWCLPEILRARASAELAFGRKSEAMATLREAVLVADTSGGVSWKLRAALSLAKLLRDEGRTSEAHQALRSTCAQFHEGFDTQDLREARLLLADAG